MGFLSCLFGGGESKSDKSNKSPDSRAGDHSIFYYLDQLKHSVGTRVFLQGGIAQDPELYERVHRGDSPADSILALIRGNRLLTICPYCNASLLNVNGQYSFHGSRDDLWGVKNGAQCTRCNWWYVQRKGTYDSDESDMIDDFTFTQEGVICRFAESIWKTPLEAAEQELGEFSRSLSTLSPTEVEKLVGEVLSQYLQCEVRHVGRPHDHGIDLLVIRGDESIAVQVKYRRHPDKRESVIPIREFVGAMIGEGFTRGIYVTTAPGYTKDAKRYTETLGRTFAPLNLVSIHELRDFIGNLSSDRWGVYDRAWADDARFGAD